MKKKDIRDIVVLAMQQKPQALDNLCAEIGRDILYICTKIMGHRQDGEDAAQEVYIKLQNGISKLQNPDVFHIWINRVIMSACNDLHRKKINLGKNDDIEDYMDVLMEDKMDFLPAEYMEDATKRDTLLSIIDELPENYRKAVLLYYYEGVLQKDIAQVLGTSENAVEHTLRRARTIIRKKLEDQTGEKMASGMYAIAAAPVLTTVLQQQASSMFPAAVVQNIFGGFAKQTQGGHYKKSNSSKASHAGGQVAKVLAILGSGLVITGIIFLSASIIKGKSLPAHLFPISSAASSGLASSVLPQYLASSPGAAEGLDISSTDTASSAVSLPVEVAVASVVSGHAGGQAPVSS
ncbi:sigma-70 family RNA polymerase sigma factor [Ruminococcaceae bacterium OttesenSCG-928-A16]|nr:sigma-70 family RNA polymerase sigma factor [Ruminococcaceae bacterium OttesenSCG-928-A16]